MLIKQAAQQMRIPMTINNTLTSTYSQWESYEDIEELQEQINDLPPRACTCNLATYTAILQIILLLVKSL